MTQMSQQQAIHNQVAQLTVSFFMLLYLETHFLLFQVFVRCISETQRGS